MAIVGNPVGAPTLGDQPLKIQHIPNNWLRWDTIVVPQCQISPQKSEPIPEQLSPLGYMYRNFLNVKI
jgi:hypothetical protein